jgi:hypothetical protein
VTVAVVVGATVVAGATGVVGAAVVGVAGSTVVGVVGAGVVGVVGTSVGFGSCAKTAPAVTKVIDTAQVKVRKRLFIGYLSFSQKENAREKYAGSYLH